MRKKFFKAADDIFGPGCMSMIEYCRIQMFKGENSVEELIEKAIGSNRRLFLENMKRNDPLKIVTAL